MVRIVSEEKPKPKAQEPEAPTAQLDGKAESLLRLIGIIIADKPRAVQSLLEEYSISFAARPNDKQLTEELLSAIAEGDTDFNRDLARIILDCTLDHPADPLGVEAHYDEPSQNASAGGGGGLWGGIANAIGGISSAIGQGIKGKQAKDQASAQTLQSIYAYKAQVAAGEQNRKRTKTMMLIAFFILMGVAVTAVFNYLSKPGATSTIPKT